MRRAVIREARAFVTAIRFLTRIPLPPVDPAGGTGAAQADQEVICRSVRWYAAVGVLLGALLWLAAWILHVARLPAPGGAALLVVVDILLTGGLHLDGWMDTADGLGSWRSRERMLAIMRDSRVGAMGVLAACGALLVEWAFLQIWWSRGAAVDVLLTAWGLGRWVMGWAVAVYP
ncbi:MAG: adenosylcobinamide-GDP ribazoletransferase, partial [Alicyclobacillaceae bacterium]|nr:adenosylcobinamide-GDP ribazoletransferase [Alicyclobacillaceae bacterium]